MQDPALERFGPAVRGWFAATFSAPTEVQRRGWAAIAEGAHALLVAPTGSGKTLAAFLAGIDAVSRLPPGAPAGVRIVYVSPLKALVHDVERNLRAPLAGIRRAAERLGLGWRDVRVDVRTGDTPQSVRVRQAREPAEILVTTPESLFLILGARAREGLATVGTVIVDEVHALAPTKRGSHLALSLERLAECAARDPQRIGLSATVRPLDEAARFLGGQRPVEVVDAATAPHIDVLVSVPVPDMARVELPPAELVEREMRIPARERGMWPAIYPELIAAVRAHRSTIVFVNSRGACERLTQRLNELAGEQLVRAHHGSVSREQRVEIEDGLKSGRIRGIVATSSLELGIDMGAVDLVLLVESPGSVARGLQRVGRAGHQVEAVSVGRIFPKFRGDLLECAVVAARMRAGQIESLRVPRNALDVLAQQVTALCCERPRGVAEIERLVRRAYPYRELGRGSLEAVLDMLSGRYPSHEFSDLRPLLSWDRATDVLTARRRAPLVVRLNAGTIPDRGTFAVRLGADGPRVGELDEEMVHETKRGDNVLLGATTWRVEEIGRDSVIVVPAPGEPGRLPFWKGAGPGRPVELGRAVGAFVRRLGAQPPEHAVEWLLAETPLDRFAAENLAAHVFEQREHTGALPTDRSITIERFRDELGDWRVCILSPFGAPVHAPWAMAIQRALGLRSGLEVETLHSDDGIVLRLADADEPPDVGVLLPDPDEVEERVAEQLAGTALFAGLFRENAVRALVLTRRRPGQRTPLWAQRLRAQNLLGVARGYPDFPVVLETYREALSDVFDMAGLRELLSGIRSREVAVHEVETRSASPFARSLVFAWVAAYMYEGDAPAAERRAQALTVDRGLLAELLGQAGLRELIEPAVVAAVERELQHLADDRRARDADELHDLLRRLGAVDEGALASRTAGEPREWLERLERERRAVRVDIAGTAHWIAAEDAGLYRDALGCTLPGELPAAYLAPVERALETLLARFARHHGPFLTRDVAGRFALLPAHVEPVLEALEARGALARGEIRPGGAELDWCDAEVLRRLKRDTLARLRGEIAAVDAPSLGRFLPRWHGIGGSRRGPERLLEVVGQIEGLALPWTSLVLTLLPERVPGFAHEQLDTLSASGALVWVGRGALGAKDGRVALYRRTHARLLLEPEADDSGVASAAHPLRRGIVEHLEQRGASFLLEIEEAVLRAIPGSRPEELRAALWDLVWAGRITNDTFAPLRWLSHAAPSRPRGRVGALLFGGRWSLVRGLVDRGASPEARAIARAESLLERYGVVSREAAVADDVPGGFGPLYRVLRAMEEAGRVRRGHFVEGLSGAQFAHPGAVDRLRALRAEEHRDVPCTDDDVVALEALDPANPWGALLAWPATGNPDEAAPRRVPGAWVLLVRGRPALWIGPRGRQLVSFPETLRDEPGVLEVTVRALQRLPRGARRGLVVVERIDGVPARESPLRDALRGGGFQEGGRGLVSVRY